MGLYRKLRGKGDTEAYIFCVVSLCGLLAAMIGDTYTINYAYWLLLGIGYAMCFGRSGDERLNNE